MSSGRGKRKKQITSRKKTSSQGVAKQSQSEDLKLVLEQFGRLSREQRSGFLSQVTVVEQEQYSGPIPTAEQLAKYQKILPDAADRILKMAEKEQDIKWEATRGQIENQDKLIGNDTRRVYSATLLGFVLLVIAGLATWQGNTVIAIPLGLAGIVASLLKFAIDWLKQKR